jgi:RNAse (barnase) inhibitor barstar
MKPIFTWQDFKECNGLTFDYANQKAAELANKKIQELVALWPVVWCDIGKTQPLYIQATQMNHTHKARLAFIEEINKEPCKQHKPSMSKMGNANWEILTSNERGSFLCAACGIEIEPTWSEKK